MTDTTLRMADILAAKRQLDALGPPMDDHGFYGALAIGGIKLFEDIPLPKIIVRQRWWMSDEFHRGLQERMVARFGYREQGRLLEPGQVLMFGNNVLMSRADLVRCKGLLDKS
jgi:hypothetical protein